MPTKKHKRKASAHFKPNAATNAQQSGLVTSHPKAFFWGGMFFIAFGLYLLTFESQDNAMFGLAMIALIIGVVTAIYANITT